RMMSQITICHYTLSFCNTSTPYIYTFPYTTLFRSPGVERIVGLAHDRAAGSQVGERLLGLATVGNARFGIRRRAGEGAGGLQQRSEEHTSELQSRFDIVCRLLLEKKKRGRD